MNVQANHDALSRIARLQRANAIIHDDIMAAAARSEKVLDGLERDLAAFRTDSDARLTDADRRAIAVAQRAEAERARVAGNTLGAAGPGCPKCGRPMTLVVQGGQGKGDQYGCGPCGTWGVSW